MNITRCGNGGYWLVTIRCKDRNKLLFDTVCTLADMDYDVYHATIDSQEGIAHQEYYIKPRYGGTGDPRSLIPALHESLACLVHGCCMRVVFV